MNLRKGQLKEISPWGTGFIEDGNGAFFGFHHSMLPQTTDLPENTDWSEVLRDRDVNFQLVDGVVTHVVIVGSTAASSFHAEAGV